MKCWVGCLNRFGEADRYYRWPVTKGYIKCPYPVWMQYKFLEPIWNGSEMHFRNWDMLKSLDQRRNTKFLWSNYLNWIHFLILEKMRSCLWKLRLGFWSHSLVCLLVPIAPNVVSRPQAPRSISFLRFHNFIGLISWFWRKWGPVCENWSYSSGLMAGYVFWAQVAQMWF